MAQGDGLDSILDEALAGPQKPSTRKTAPPVAKLPVIGRRPAPGPRRGIADRLRGAQEATGEFFDNMGASIADEWSSIPQLMDFKHIRRPGARPPTADEQANARLESTRDKLNAPQTDPFGMPVYNTPRAQQYIDKIAPGTPTQRAAENTPWAKDGSPTGEPGQKGTRGYREARASGETIESLRAIAADPTRKPEDQKYAADAAHNLAVRQEREAGKGGMWERAISRASFGMLDNAGHIYEDIRRAGETGDIVSEEDLTKLGAKTKTGETMRTEPTFGEGAKEEMLPGMVADAGSLMLLGPSRAIGRAAALAEESGAKGIGAALRFTLQNEAPVAEGWRARAMLRGARGAVQGSGVSASHDMSDVLNQGGTVQEGAQVAATGALLGATMGSVLEAGGGALWDAIGPTTKRWLNAAARKIPPTAQHLDDLAAQILREQDAKAATAAVNAERARSGGVPVDDQNPEAHLKAIAHALEQILSQKEESRASYPDEVGAAFGSADRPGSYNPAGPEWWRENTDLPDATTAGLARAGEPREGEAAPQQGPTRLADQADMSRNLERIKAEEEAAAQQARLEQAAALAPSEKQGPLTLAQTLRNPNARAAVVAGAGGQFDENNDDDVSLAFLAGITSPAVRKAIIEEADKAIKVGEKIPSLRVLAAKHGISSETVRTILKVAGIGGNVPERVNLGALKEAGERNRAGESLDKLAPEYGYKDASGLKNAMKRHGIEARDRATAGSDRSGPYRPEQAKGDERVLSKARAIFARHGIEVSDDVWTRAQAAIKKNGPAAGMAFLAAQTDDEDTRNALTGAAVLATGVVVSPEKEGEFFSRTRAHILSLPDKTLPAADWLGKLGAGNVPIPEGEFRFLRPVLEQAKVEKRKLSRADVVQMFDDATAGELPEIKRVRLAEKLATPGRVHDPSQPHAVVVSGEDPALATPRREPNTPIKKWDPNDGDADRAAGRVEQERERLQEEVDDHQSTAEEFGTHVDSILDEVGHNDRYGRERLLRMIEDADDGSGDGELQRQDLVDSIRDHFVDEPESPDSPTNLDEEGEWDYTRQDDGTYKVSRSRGSFYDNTTGDYHYRGDPGVSPDDPRWTERIGEGEEFPTKYHAMAYVQSQHGEPGEYGTWGNLDDVMRELRVEQDGDDGDYYLTQNRWDGARREYRQQRVNGYSDSDPDDLVRSYLDDHLEHHYPEPEYADMSNIAKMVRDLNESRMASVKHSDAQMALDDTDWDEKLAEAEAEDKQNKLDYYKYHAGLKNHDPEYHMLDSDDQAFHDRGRELGAVGYTRVGGGEEGAGADLDLFEQAGIEGAGTTEREATYHLTDENGDPESIGDTRARDRWLAEGADPSRIKRTFRGGGWDDKQLVFDASLPHEPLLRKGEPMSAPDEANWTDPEQQSFTDDTGFNPVKYIALKAQGDSKFKTYQRIGGGKNYREILLHHSNWPFGGLNAGGDLGHWWSRSYGYTLKDTFAHLRVETHTHVMGRVVDNARLTEATEAYKKAHKKHSDWERYWRDITAEIPEQFAVDLPYVSNIRDRVQSAMNGMNDAQSTFVREYQRAVERDPGAVPEEVTYVFEAQADAAQKSHESDDMLGTRTGFKEQITDPDTQLSETVRPVYAARQKSDALQEALYKLSEKVDAARAALDRGDEGSLENFNAAEAEYSGVARQRAEAESDFFAVMQSIAPEVRSPSYTLKEDIGKAKRDLFLARRGLTVEPSTSYYGNPTITRPVDGAIDIARVREAEAALKKKVDLYRDSQQYQAVSGGDKVLNPHGITPTKNNLLNSNEAGLHVAAGAALLEAAHADTPILAISTADNRRNHASLSLKAGRITYDQLMSKYIEKIAKQLGHDIKREPMVLNGSNVWAWRLPPALRKKIRDVGVPLMSLLAMTQMANQNAERDGSGDKPLDSVLDNQLLVAGSLLVSKGKVNGALKEGEKAAFHYFEHNIGKRATSLLRVANVTRSVAANALKQGKEYLRVPAKAIYDMALDPDGIVSKVVRLSGHASWGDVEAAVSAAGYAGLKPEGGAPPRLIGMKGNPDAPLPTKITSAQERARAEGGFKLYSNPIGPAFNELRRKTTPAALAMLGYAASQEDDHRNISRMAPPLFALAALNAIGTKRLGKAFDSTGDAVLQALVRSDTGKKFVQFMNPEALLSPDIKAAVQAYEETVSKGRALAAEFGGAARKLGPVKDRQVSDVIEHEDWEGVGQANSLDVIVTAQAIKNEFDVLARRKMASGVIEPHMVIDNYLPRRYAHWDALDVYANEQGRGKGGGGGSKTRISEQKRRTLDIPVRDAESVLREAQAAGDPVKVKAAEDALDEAYYSQLDQRLKLGEIRESSYRTAHGLSKGYSDVAAAELFKQLSVQPDAIHPEFKQHLDDFLAARKAHQQAASPTARAAAEVAMDAAQVNMAEVTRRFTVKGGDWVSMPDSKGLGVFRGMVVNRNIAHTINGIPEQRALDKLVQFWKVSKTVFNPGTHIANILSNTTVAHMAGLNMIEQAWYLPRAFRDIKAYGSATRHLTEKGTLGINTVSASSEGVIPTGFKSDRGLRELAQTTRPETRSVLADVSQGATEKPFGVMDKLQKVGAKTKAIYNREDDLFRVALYMKRIDMGDTPEAAAKAAHEEFGNFRTRSPALRVLRGGVAPFVLYPAKLLPRFAKNVVDHPGRYMTLVAGWAALDQIGAQSVGEVDEEDIEYRDRRLLGYFFPGFTQLPMENDQGDKGGYDVARYTPVTGLTDVAQPGSPGAALSDRFPKILQPAGPMTDLYAKFANNYDTYLQQPRYKAYYGAKTNLARGLEDAAQFALPSVAGFHAETLYKDYKNKDFDKMKNDALGPTGLRPRYAAKGRAMDNADYQLDKDLADIKRDMNRALDRTNDPARTEEIMRETDEREDRANSLHDQRAYTRK